MSNAAERPAHVHQVVHAKLDQARCSSGLTRMSPALAPRPPGSGGAAARRRSGRASAEDAARRSARARGCRMSLANQRRRPCAPRASFRSSPAVRLLAGGLALPTGATACRGCSSVRGSRKWCASRKKDVRLVVRLLTNSCHSRSGLTLRALQPMQVRAERAVAEFAQPRQPAGIDHRPACRRGPIRHGDGSARGTRSKSSSPKANSAPGAGRTESRATGRALTRAAPGGPPARLGRCGGRMEREPGRTRAAFISARWRPPERPPRARRHALSALTRRRDFLICRRRLIGVDATSRVRSSRLRRS